LRSRLREWFLTGAQISYRRLCCERGTRFQIRSNNFVEKVQGLKYGLSIKTLMLNKKDQWPADKRKFFCSELVAAYYKHLGFIQSFAKSHTYMPGDFADKGVGARLNLVDAYLEHEVKVMNWAESPRSSEVSQTLRGRSSSLNSCCDGLSLYPRVSSSEVFKRRRSYSSDTRTMTLGDMDDEKCFQAFDKINIEHDI